MKGVSGSGLVSLWPTAESLRVALLFTIRFGALLLVVAALLRMHAPQTYGREVVRSLSSLPFARAAIARTELVGSLALRFVPFLQQEARRLRLALAARGTDVRSGRSRALRSAGRLMFPLVVSAIRRADHVALALDARGFDLSSKRSWLKRTPVRIEDVVITGVFAAVAFLVPWL